MKAVIEIIGLIQSRAIDRNQGLSLIERLKYARETANINSGRSDEGKSARLAKTQFIEQLKEAGVVPTLRNLGSMSYYPMHLNGKKFSMAEKTEVLDELIANCNKYIGDTNE